MWVDASIVTPLGGETRTKNGDDRFMFGRVDLSGFDDLWKQVGELKVLPNTAIEQVPSFLSDKTKRKLMKKTPREIAEIVDAAVDKINHGSVEVLDVLIQKEIKARC